LIRKKNDCLSFFDFVFSQEKKEEKEKVKDGKRFRKKKEN